MRSTRPPKPETARWYATEAPCTAPPTMTTSYAVMPVQQQGRFECPLRRDDGARAARPCEPSSATSPDRRQRAVDRFAEREFRFDAGDAGEVAEDVGVQT